MSTKRYDPKVRTKLILRAAVLAAAKPGGWSSLTRRAIATEAGVSDGLVSQRLGDMPKIRRTVMRVAIREDIVEIIAQSIVAHDGYAVKNKALRQRALASLLG